MSERTEKPKRYVVVTTGPRRGVFGGVLESGDIKSGVVVLSEARMCIHWTQEMRGVHGLALNGPGAGCRIGHALPRLELNEVDSIADMTPKALAAWEAEPWGR